MIETMKKILPFLLFLGTCTTQINQTAPLVSTDELNSELRENGKHVPNNSWCKIYSDMVCDYATHRKISMPNGSNLLVPKEDPYSGDIYSESGMIFGETDIVLEKKDGARQILFLGYGFADPLTKLSVKNGNVYVKTYLMDSDKYQINQYILKCSESECWFYIDSDCMLPQPPTVKTPTEIENELREMKWIDKPNHPWEDKIKYLEDNIIAAALSGKKENLDFLFNRKLLNQYFRFDAALGETYSGYSDIFRKYSKRCMNYTADNDCAGKFRPAKTLSELKRELAAMPKDNDAKYGNLHNVLNIAYSGDKEILQFVLNRNEMARYFSFDKSSSPPSLGSLYQEYSNDLIKYGKKCLPDAIDWREYSK